ncbi:hypothetical protein [Primorskyibacter marinus]|uniref:hypothetical protein n=1 Tax=Primorskyibacter marinus TaxID=1977320 RepID=UPI000E3065F9|nr:hypothetical protein [Primorskyibacter marinus]
MATLIDLTGPGRPSTGHSDAALRFSYCCHYGERSIFYDRNPAEWTKLPFIGHSCEAEEERIEPS